MRGHVTFKPLSFSISLIRVAFFLQRILRFRTVLKNMYVHARRKQALGDGTEFLVRRQDGKITISRRLKNAVEDKKVVFFLLKSFPTILGGRSLVSETAANPPVEFSNLLSQASVHQKQE